MIDSYSIRFTFRGGHVSGYVQVYDDHALVNVTDTDIINAFTSVFKFSLPDKNFIPGFQRDKDAKDLVDLTRAMKAQLH